ncbi:MAG: helix-turn-helix domain-containing protein, partial [Solirubrobacteraceae bacterium]
PRPSVSTVATSPSPQAAEAPVAEPPAAEPTAVQPQADEPLAAEPPAAEPPAPEPPAAEPSAGEPPAAELPAAEPQVATRHAVLAALAGGSAMTAGEVATATGLGRANVSAMLSKLAEAGELRNAARGYQLADVEPAQRFYFGIEDEVTPRAVVANLPELEAAIAVCGPGVLRHHCAEHDFSRWVAGVLRTEPLADAIAAAEAQLSADSPTETVEHARRALTAALQARHATQR